MGAKAGVELEQVVCPACSFSSKFLTKFEAHLVATHGVTSQGLWDALHGGPIKCACGCGDDTTWLGWKAGYAHVLRGHNGNLVAVHGEEKAASISAKRAAALKGRPGWAQGLTKASDSRVAARAKATSHGRKRAFAEGRLAAWSKGLTKQTDPRVAAAAEAMKDAYMCGLRRPWALGLTKQTDQRVATMAAKNSITHSLKEIRAHLDGQKRRSVDEVRTLIEATGELQVVAGLDAYKNECKSIIEVECKTCHTRSRTVARHLYGGRCRACHPMGSLAQLELLEFVHGLASDVVACDRTVIAPMELDVWVPSRMFGIEFNGLYWHSELNKSSTYHANKTKLAHEQGVKLLHVFEDDWRDRRPIVESLIRHRLGVTQQRVSARQCQLAVLAPKERRAFFEANHLDGDTAAAWCVGLKHNGEIVMALSLRKPFHKGHAGRLEVARSCPRIDAVVRGGLSRLTKAALKHARSAEHIGLITYVDGRVGDGAGYVAAGFKKTGETPPRFWWTDFSRRFNRFKFKANSKEGLTERAVAAEAGVVKVWGCPNVVLMIDV